ncbi:MAG: transglycosylase SLT domain-containing protein [Gemmobacter sp.]|uniref:transglycosylase SLT domain-containing protein n=1 Tax=Gemmobacter sp. TaxID=1898957 RepID=UPI001A5C42A8|nr:transglycosylase SLT domain-containing protein [Gemmobacter sp.]MBL8561989.1 transglycosylase SLT domain-containing protein [Gemmobacter sp.]
MLSLLLRLALLPLLCGPAFASPAALCDQAAQIAAQETGVPLAVLQALTRAETGRGGGAQLEPWPWAVNQAGQGHWFDSAAEAEQFVEAQLEFGYSNLDVGCFQLNHRWHSKGFSSLAAMFQPQENAIYAARYIAEKYQETGDWVLAAGAYHSGTVEHAEKYAARFEQILADLGDGLPVPEGVIRLAELTEDPAPRINRFPLLMAGNQAGARGSLVPLTAGVGSLFAQVP